MQCGPISSVGMAGLSVLKQAKRVTIIEVYPARDAVLFSIIFK